MFDEFNRNITLIKVSNFKLLDHLMSIFPSISTKYLIDRHGKYSITYEMKHLYNYDTSRSNKPSGVRHEILNQTPDEYK